MITITLINSYKKKWFRVSVVRASEIKMSDRALLGGNETRQREGKGGRKEGMTFVECVSRIYTLPSQNDSDV